MSFGQIGLSVLRFYVRAKPYHRRITVLRADDQIPLRGNIWPSEISACLMRRDNFKGHTGGIEVFQGLGIEGVRVKQMLANVRPSVGWSDVRP